MSNRHVAVWLDHNEARIFHVTPRSFDESTIDAPRAHTQLHRKMGPGADSGRRADEDAHYYHSIALALKEGQELLVVGPATAKLELVKHIHKHHPDLVSRLIGVETVDHPTDRQLADYFRRYFKAIDRMRGT